MGALTSRNDEPRPRDELVGKIVSGKYLVLAMLGTGGMGTVYECENLSVGRRVALKLLNPIYAAHREAVGRFEREARSAALIGHPNIIDVIDMGRTDDGVPYIVMERLDGEDLFSLLERVGTLKPGLVLDIATQTLGALGAAHAAGIVHRDLKPDNIFLARRGARTDFVKILDWGIAKMHDELETSSRRLTRDGSVLGTPSYMSPEQAAGSREVDGRSDLYTVGVLIYEMLSGQMAYPGDNYNEIIVAISSRDPVPLATIAPWVNKGLADVVMRSLARAPSDRYQTAAEFLGALEPFGDVMELEVPSGLWKPTLNETPPLPTRLPQPSVDSSRPMPTMPGVSNEEPPSSLQPVTLVDELPVPRRTGLWVTVVLSVVGIAAVVSGALLLPGAMPEAARTQHRSIAPSPEVQRPAAAAAPPSASLSVDSNVEGARVWLDGIDVGVTPLRRNLPTDTALHTLRLEAPGRRTAERQIHINGPLSVIIDLSDAAESAPAPPTKATKVKGRGKQGLIFRDNVY